MVKQHWNVDTNSIHLAINTFHTLPQQSMKREFHPETRRHRETGCRLLSCSEQSIGVRCFIVASQLKKTG